MKFYLLLLLLPSVQLQMPLNFERVYNLCCNIRGRLPVCTQQNQQTPLCCPRDRMRLIRITAWKYNKHKTHEQIGRVNYNNDGNIVQEICYKALKQTTADDKRIYFALQSNCYGHVWDTWSRVERCVGNTVDFGNLAYLYFGGKHTERNPVQIRVESNHPSPEVKAKFEQMRLKYIEKDLLARINLLTAPNVTIGRERLDQLRRMVAVVEDSNDAHRGTHRCILLIGGFDLNSDAATVEYYHPTDDVECNMDMIGNMSTERVRNETKHTSGCYLSSTQQIIIREAVYPDKPPMVYGLKNGSARQLPIPFKKHTLATTTAAVGSLKCLSCGGYGDNADSDGVAECYQFNPFSNDSKWTPIASMSYLSYYAASVSLTENDYYVMGGNSKGTLDKLHRFNVDDGTWTEETPMQTPRSAASAAPLSNTKFIVCGGINAIGVLSTCEIYDTTLQIWSFTGSLKKGRSGFVMTNFGGDIYALGGQGSGVISMNTTEKYNRTTGEWEMAKAMKHARQYFVGVAV